MDPSPNIHILHVVPGLAPGGMELTLARLVTALSIDNMRHSIACLKGDVEIAPLLPQQTDIYLFHSRPNEPQLPWRLTKLLRKIRPHVIHARNWGTWPDVALARFGVWPPTPLIFSFHGTGEAGYMPLRRRLISRVLVRMTTCLFTVSETTRQMLVSRWGWPKQNVAVIPNGVDIRRFKPRQRPIRRPALIVGNVGGLRPVKNQALLVRACAQLAAEGIDLELRIAGEGPERENLTRLAGSLNFDERLKLYGYIENTPDFLCDLDIFVLSSDSEAHPNALIEALACGIPCIATRVGSAPEILDDNRYGRLIEPADTNGLAQALLTLINHPDLRAELGSNGRQHACDNYSMERMIASYTRLYKEISQRRK